jgi:hypothetical protein
MENECHSGSDYVMHGCSCVQLCRRRKVGSSILPLFCLSRPPLPPSAPPSPPSRVMLVMFIAFLIAAFALLCIRVPSVWSALMAIDEPSDPNELGLVVASRASYPSPTPSPSHSRLNVSGNPFRESGPPACMAKLIMMRHKVRKISFSFALAQLSCALYVLTYLLDASS